MQDIGIIFIMTTNTLFFAFMLFLMLLKHVLISILVISHSICLWTTPSVWHIWKVLPLLHKALGDGRHLLHKALATWENCEKKISTVPRAFLYVFMMSLIKPSNNKFFFFPRIFSQWYLAIMLELYNVLSWLKYKRNR